MNRDDPIDIISIRCRLLQVPYKLDHLKQLFPQLPLLSVLLIKFDQCTIQFLNQLSFLFVQVVDLRQEVGLDSHLGVALRADEPISELVLLLKSAIIHRFGRLHQLRQRIISQLHLSPLLVDGDLLGTLLGHGQGRHLLLVSQLLNGLFLPVHLIGKLRLKFQTIKFKSILPEK